MRRFALLAFALGILGCNAGPDEMGASGGKARSLEMELKAADGTKVYCERYRPPNQARSIILMFHQAGSNSGEYAEIAPKIVDRDVECLSVDLRSGGKMWDRENKTATNSGKADWKYEDAYQDMVAAVEWAKRRGFGKIAIWGSSYSASLCLKLAKEHPVNAVILFSPGEYFEDKKQVAKWNSELRIPCFFAFTHKEAMDYGYSLQQAAPNMAERRKDQIAVNKGGIHGSSTLLKDKCPEAYGFYWQELTRFLDSQRLGKTKTD